MAMPLCSSEAVVDSCCRSARQRLVKLQKSCPNLLSVSVGCNLTQSSPRTKIMVGFALNVLDTFSTVCRLTLFRLGLTGSSPFF
jgi:hypothetical protein